MSRLSIVAALSAKRRAVGRKNKLLWHLPEDLKRFKELTLGHPIIMGRKTWESLPPSVRPLPGRENIVITRDIYYKAPGATLVHSFEAACFCSREFEHKNPSGEVLVIGGAEIYAHALPLVERLYLTIVEDEPDADSFFPDYSAFTKRIGETEQREKNGIRYSWITLEKE